MTMAETETTMMDFTISSCSSVNGGKEGSVKMYCTSVVQGWAATSI